MIITTYPHYLADPIKMLEVRFYILTCDKRLQNTRHTRVVRCRYRLRMREIMLHGILANNEKQIEFRE